MASNNQKPSFAHLAQSFLSRPMSASTASTSQPMFFSFTTDGSEGNIGRSQYPHHDDHDGDDPHLLGGSNPVDDDDDDDNPYLRLDEADNDIPSSTKGKARESVPLIMQESRRSEAQGGWLAHAMASPSTSPSSSPSSDNHIPPPDILFSPTRNHMASPPPPPRLAPQRISIDSSQLTESLLPSHHPSGTNRKDTFALPDPALYPTRSRRKYHDSFWMSAFLFSMAFIYIAALLMLIVVKKPKGPPDEGAKGGWHTPYSTLLRTIPLLTILTMASACGAYLHVLLLSRFVGIVMWTTELLTPVLLLISSLWAFIGSFVYDDDIAPTWGETIGLRLFSIIPFLMAIYTARNLFEISFVQDTTTFTTSTASSRRRRRPAQVPTTTRKFSPQIKLSLPSRIRKASKTLKLTVDIVMDNPFLMLLSPALLLGLVGVGSLPFGVVGVRLLLIGSFEQEGGTWAFHLRPYVLPLLLLTIIVWLWGIMTARGILRVVTAGVVGKWVYTDPASNRPPPFSTPSLLLSRETLHAALFRATQPSFGTICLAALLLSLARLLSYTALIIHRLPIWSRGILGLVGGALPGGFTQARGVVMLASALAWIGRVVAGWCERKAGILSRYALIHTGLTGSAFWTGVSRAKVLTSSSRSTSSPHLPLSLTPLLLPLPNALGTYFFVAHTLKSPQEAFGSALVAAVGTLVVGGWVVGGVEDVAESLYLCYCIDVMRGTRTREEVWDAFEHDQTSVPPPLSAATQRAGGDEDDDQFDQPILPTYHRQSTGSKSKKTHPLPVPRPLSLEPSEDEDSRDNTPRAHQQQHRASNSGDKWKDQVESEGSEIDPFNVGISGNLDNPATAPSYQGGQQMDDVGGEDLDGSDVFPGSGLFG